MTFEESLKGDERVSFAAIWWKNNPSQGNSLGKSPKTEIFKACFSSEEQSK